MFWGRRYNVLSCSVWHYWSHPGFCVLINSIWHYWSCPGFVSWPERWQKTNEMILSCSDISVILCWILGYFDSSFLQPWALWSWQEKLEAKFWDVCFGHKHHSLKVWVEAENIPGKQPIPFLAITNSLEKTPRPRLQSSEGTVGLIPGFHSKMVKTNCDYKSQ